MKLLSLILSIVFLSGCTSYINRMYAEFDRSDAASKKTIQHDAFALYRADGRPIDNQAMVPRGTSGSTNRYAPPLVKREYKQAPGTTKRYKASDLTDNDPSGSLWVGQGVDSNLFGAEVVKKKGDIILINVMAKLKNEITAELKRTFPQSDTSTQGKAKGSAIAASANSQTASAAPPPPKPVTEKKEDESSSNETIYDQISGVIVEEVNNSHLLLRGRKQLLYNNYKRLVEVQVLVARRDILANDIVNSNKIVESTVNVLR